MRGQASSRSLGRGGVTAACGTPGKAPLLAAAAAVTLPRSPSSQPARWRPQGQEEEQVRVMEEVDVLIRTPDHGQLTLHQRRRLDEHRQSGALLAWMAAADAKRKKRSKKKLTKSRRRLLPLSARCLV